MDYIKNTLFINLEERTDRLIHVNNELNKIGVIGERVNALKMDDGAIGCSFSHIKCIEIAKEKKYPFVFICEDDIQFTDPQLFLKNFERFLHTTKEWDVIIVSGNNAPPYKKCEEFCIRVFNCQTTTGYIVREQYYDKLLNNFKNGLSMLLRNTNKRNEYAIDMYWKHLQKNDKWFMIIPPTVSQYINYSDVEKKVVNYEKLMLDVEKEWLFSFYLPENR